MHLNRQECNSSRKSLQSSLASLQSSIESQDWESATRHCARAMALPLEVISGSFAENVVVRPFLRLPRVVFSSACKAYVRKSSATCSDITICARATLVDIPTPVRSSVSFAGRCSYQSFLQTISCNRLGSRGSASVCILRCGPCPSQGPRFR
jgi:hypothetical protein